jgi:formate hydrogenlyase transcriptional activator
VPSLRERQDDIPVLVEYLVERFAKRIGKRIKHTKRETLALLQSYDWPGNIRELQNVIERAVILCEGEALSVDQAWLHRKSHRGRALSRAGALAQSEKELSARERDLIEAAVGRQNPVREI